MWVPSFDVVEINTILEIVYITLGPNDGTAHTVKSHKLSFSSQVLSTPWYYIIFEFALIHGTY